MATRRLPMFPLSTVLFPESLLPLHVFEDRYRTMMADVLATDSPDFGVVLIERGSEVGGGDVRSSLGTRAEIVAVKQAPDGRYALVVRGTERIAVRQWLADDPYPQAEVEVLADEDAPTADAPPPAARAPGGDADVAAAHAGALTAVRRMEALLSELGATPLPTPASDSPWGLCQRLPVNPLDRQGLLATDDPVARLTRVIELADAVGDDARRMLENG